MNFLRLLLPLLFLSSASAAEIKVPLIGLGWQIAFKGPELKQMGLEYPKGTIQWKANGGRFNASLFVEPPSTSADAGASHAACSDFYWPQAKRNPAIVAESVKITKRSNCNAVTYRTKGVIQDTPYVQDHVNCYFVHQGKWVDVHASIVSPTAEDTQQLADFAASLSYGPWQAAEGKAEKFVLGKLGTASLTPPAGWLTGNVLNDDRDPEHPKFTVSFFSPTDPNSNCLLTFFAAPKAPDSPESLRKAVEVSTESVVSASVEGNTVIRDIELKKGLGAVAAFTDASLVGKPIVAGNAKALATGMIVPKENVIAVVSMFMDEATGADAGKMMDALATLALD